jgi:hypothetical protein
MRRVRVKAETAFVAWGVVADVPDCVVEVHDDGTVLLVDGAVERPLIGRVELGDRSWERRTPGRRYVNARGRTPEWKGWYAGSRSVREDAYGRTRGEVLVKLVAEHLHREGKSRKVGA